MVLTLFLQQVLRVRCRVRRLRCSTCSAETSVTVDRDLPLLQGEGHDLHHVQHRRQVGHPVVAPAEIVEINCKDVLSVALKVASDLARAALTVVFHEDLWTVGETTLLLQGGSTAGVFARNLQVHHGFDAVPVKTDTDTSSAGFLLGSGTFTDALRTFGTAQRCCIC